ncbi:hypothetical protein ASF22_21655 [Methylobacterium sp. Leaf87]|nr:hypothetical protein ASF22_21655 [Methylobacterium sp. Leaf87]
MKLLRDQEIRIEDMPLNRDSVQLLVSLIEDAGGLNALERLMDRDKDPDWAPEPLELDPKRKSAILQARALSALQNGSDVIPRLVFVHKKEDGTEQELPVPDNIVSLAVAAQAPTPPRTQAFAELLVMGGCVLPEPTDERKTKASDPNDGHTEWRIDERQVVWDPDQRIIQGLLKAKGGTVVVECWNHEPIIILGARVEGDTRLYTEMRKRIEVNILARERRSVFDVDVEATEKKSGVGMLKVSSGAANPSKPIRALLQRLTGEGFVDVDPNRLKASAQCVISRGVLHGFASAYIDKADKAVRNASKPRSGTAQVPPGSTVEFGSDGINVRSAMVDADKKPVAGKMQGDGSISVRLDDLTAFLKAFIAVYPEVNTEVMCSLGDRVLIWEFGTTSARYRVLIPQANRGARSDGFTTPLVRREWPESVVLKTSVTA